MNDGIIEKLSYPTLIQSLQPTPAISRLSNTKSNIMNTLYTQTPVEIVFNQENPSIYYTGNSPQEDKGISPARTMIPTYDKFGNLIVIPSYRYKQNMIWSIPTGKTIENKNIKPYILKNNKKDLPRRMVKKKKNRKIEKFLYQNRYNIYTLMFLIILFIVILFTFMKHKYRSI